MEENRRFPLRKVVSSDEAIANAGMEIAAEDFTKPIEIPQVEKSERFTHFINAVNREMVPFLHNYGCESVRFPPERIVIPDMDKLPDDIRKRLQADKASKVGGFWKADKEFIAILRNENFGNTPNGTLFMQNIIHEMLHPNSFQSRTMKPIAAEQEVGDHRLITLIRRNLDTGEMFKEMYSYHTRRVGLNVVIEGRDRNLFEKLDEAVITELEIRFFYEHGRNIPELQPVVESIEKAIAAAVAKDPTFDSFSKKRDINFLSSEPIEGSEDCWYEWAEQWPYEKERKNLWLLIDELYAHNQEKFKDREEVFRIFTDAVLNGRLLPLARLVEGVYGKGSFRYLGEQTSF